MLGCLTESYRPKQGRIQTYPDTVSLNRRIASMCWSGPLRPARMVLTDRWVAPTLGPGLGQLAPVVLRVGGDADAALDADVVRVRPAFTAPCSRISAMQLSRPSPSGWNCGNQPSPMRADAPHHLGRAAAEPHGDGLHRQRVDAGVGDLVVAAMVV